MCWEFRPNRCQSELSWFLQHTANFNSITDFYFFYFLLYHIRLYTINYLVKTLLFHYYFITATNAIFVETTAFQTHCFLVSEGSGLGAFSLNFTDIFLYIAFSALLL